MELYIGLFGYSLYDVHLYIDHGLIQRVLSFGALWDDQGQDQWSKWYIKGKEKSLSRVEASIPLMQHDPSG